MSALYAEDAKRTMREQERKKARYKGNKVFSQETGKWVNKKEYQNTLNRDTHVSEK